MKNYYSKITLACIVIVLMGTSCVISKKKCAEQQALEAAKLTRICDERVDVVKKELQKITDDFNKLSKESSDKLLAKDLEISNLKIELAKNQVKSESESDKIADLKTQLNNSVADLKAQLNNSVSDLKKTHQDIELLRDVNTKLFEEKSNLKYNESTRKTRDSLIKNVYENLTKGLNIDNTNGDIEVKVDKAVVYVDISEKVLFKSGSFELTDKANASLEQIAKLIQAKSSFDVIVEGHTDDVPYNGSKEISDNWDLSAKRATAVVRLLKNNYGVNPSRITAAGRAEFNPIADNKTVEGRAKNRRIKIIITPTLEQFGKLLEKAIE